MAISFRVSGIPKATGSWKPASSVVAAAAISGSLLRP
jgi:hypothetical protein